MNPVCIECHKETRIEKNGVIVLEFAYDPPQPYKAWNADLFVCPVCGKAYTAGFGQVADYDVEKYKDIPAPAGVRDPVLVLMPHEATADKPAYFAVFPEIDYYTNRLELIKENIVKAIKDHEHGRPYEHTGG